jgi:hypothetical protein
MKKYENKAFSIMKMSENENVFNMKIIGGKVKHELALS